MIKYGIEHNTTKGEKNVLNKSLIGMSSKAMSFVIIGNTIKPQKLAVSPPVIDIKKMLKIPFFNFLLAMKIAKKKAGKKK